MNLCVNSSFPTLLINGLRAWRSKYICTIVGYGWSACAMELDEVSRVCSPVSWCRSSIERKCRRERERVEMWSLCASLAVPSRVPQWRVEVCFKICFTHRQRRARLQGRAQLPIGEKRFCHKTNTISWHSMLVKNLTVITNQWKREKLMGEVDEQELHFNWESSP